MSDNCSNQCSICDTNCGDKKQESYLSKPHELSNIKKVIGVISGKGGVGKSMVTSLLSVLTRREGYNTAILDADITGPSIPKAFGITEKTLGTEIGIFPVKSKTGVSIISVNLFLENDTDPVVWRGPIIAGTVKQFWTNVIWGDVDVMFVDLPPGTGDVPLTIFQSIPLDGIIVVTSPQELVGMIVEKAVKMTKTMNLPILAIVENMSYFTCPNCKEEHKIFGESHIDEIAAKHSIPTVCKIPMNKQLAVAADKGEIELIEDNSLNVIIDKIKNLGVK